MLDMSKRGGGEGGGLTGGLGDPVGDRDEGGVDVGRRKREFRADSRSPSAGAGELHYFTIVGSLRGPSAMQVISSARRRLREEPAPFRAR